MQVFYSLPKLIECADSLLPRKQVISLDMFDTLLVRRVHDPDIVKLPVARFIAALAAQAGADASWHEVHELRNRIESAHRAENGRHHPDFEANYDRFMPEVLRNVFGEKYTEDLFGRVADYEMSMEIAVLTPRARLVEWIKRVHASGKKIVLVSDIYLPARYLERLVDAKGLSGYVDEVVSSADTFRAKASGTGFTLLGDRLGISNDQWLHIGDNAISDGIRPAEQGITALVIHDIREKQRKGIVRLLHSLSGIRHFWKGRYVLQLMLPLEDGDKAREALFIDGHNLFGLILGYFIHALAEQCRQRGIRRVYFCSREGWMFYECWKRMAPHLFAGETPPDASYLEVSRIALANAACANVGLTPINANVALLPVQNHDFSDICRVYKLDMAGFTDALARAGLEPDEEIVPVNPDIPGRSTMPNPFEDLLADAEFQERVRDQGRDARDRVEAYLESEGMFEHRDVAVVDVGWLGTIQHYLNQAVMHRPRRPNLHGFLLAATRMIPYPASAESHYRGLLFDQHRFNLASSYILTVKDVIEEICRAPHPSVVGYERAEAGVRPVRRTLEDAAARSEMAQTEYYRPLHEGILEAVERYAVAVSLLGYPSAYVRPWLNFQMVTRFAFPGGREVGRIKHFFHQDDFAGEREISKAVLRRQRTLWDHKPIAIMLLPFIRLRYFYRHISRMMRLWA